MLHVFPLVGQLPGQMQHLAVSLYQILDRSWGCTRYWWSSVFFFFSLAFRHTTDGWYVSVKQPL